MPLLVAPMPLFTNVCPLQVGRVQGGAAGDRGRAAEVGTQGPQTCSNSNAPNQTCSHSHPPVREGGVEEAEEAYGEAHLWGAGAVPPRDAGPQRDGGDGLPRQQARRHGLDSLAAAVEGQAALELRGREQRLPGQRQRRGALVRRRGGGCIAAACTERTASCFHKALEVVS